MRHNNAYRRRFELTPTAGESARRDLHRIRAALQTMADDRLTRDDVVAVLEPLGYASGDVQAHGSSDSPGGLALGVSVPAGCVHGRVLGSAVELKVGGGIADGGCLPAEGH